MAAKKVAIIGAGASGLSAIKTSLDEGLVPVCFERTDDLGGLWRYTEELIEGQGCVMKSTVINTSKEMMSYSDFPIPEKYPVFMHNTQVYEYFHQYADAFGLTKHIQYHEEVLHVRKTADFSLTGQWEVKHRNKKTGEEKTEIFDGVLVCTGHHADKHEPTFPGLSDFQGKILHSRDYRKPLGYEDKRVLVIGIGNSGGDIAVELSRKASQVYLSTRTGKWILYRVSRAGYPNDMLLTSRVLTGICGILPFLADILWSRNMYALHSLRTHYNPTSDYPLVNDDLPTRIACGSIQIKTDIKRFTRTGVEFVDGTFEDNIDVVFLATGYSFSFPFIDKEIIDVQDNRVQMFKNMYPPDLEPKTLAVIGYVQPLGAIMPISEMQCRLATRVIKGVTCLPSRDEMWKDIRAKEERTAKRYAKSRRHTLQVDLTRFMDELAKLVGCSVDYFDLLKKDPALALKVFFGPATPYAYRLYGPGQWTGAREAIMNQWRRTVTPLQTRPPPQTKKNLHNNYFKMCVFFLAVLLCLLLFMLL